MDASSLIPLGTFEDYDRLKEQQRKVLKDWFVRWIFRPTLFICALCFTFGHYCLPDFVVTAAQVTYKREVAEAENITAPEVAEAMYTLARPYLLPAQQAEFNRRLIAVDRRQEGFAHAFHQVTEDIVRTVNTEAHLFDERRTFINDLCHAYLTLLAHQRFCCRPLSLEETKRAYGQFIEDKRSLENKLAEYRQCYCPPN